MKRILTGCLILCFSLIFLGPASACTIFSVCDKHRVLVGNNEDWIYRSDAKVWFIPAGKHSYGRVYFGFSLKDSAWYLGLLGDKAMGGMNDHGLFVDMAAVPKTKSPYFPGKPLVVYVQEAFLANCTDVDEAIQLAGKINVPFDMSGMYLHALFADKSGDSAVVEWVGRKLRVIRSRGSHQLITNFYLTAPQLGNYPCPRYAAAEKLLKEDDLSSVSRCAKILEAVAQHWISKKHGECGTLYSNVYNLGQGEVYLYYKGDFHHIVHFRLADELKKGKHSYKLSELFKTPDKMGI